MTRRRLLPFLLVAAASSLVTAGALALPALADDRDEPLRELDECLREHGFDLRPENGRLEVRVTPDGVWVNGEKVDAEAFRKAQRECRPHVPRLLPALPLDPDAGPPDLRERMERLEECLRLEREPDADL
jgi:hypothetical protein